MAVAEPAVISVDGLGALIGDLAKRGYRVIGPTVRDRAIVYDDIASLDDLPRGWTDEQDAGRYRIVRRNDGALFGYAVGPNSWKTHLHVPIQRLWRTMRGPNGVDVSQEPIAAERLAFLGVRACELHAIAIQDRVLVGGTYRDEHYRARRDGTFLIAVNCGSPGGTCFCVSMGTGPKAEVGFDLALTEILDAGRHCFVVETGTPRGGDLLDGIAHRAATPEEREAAARVSAGAAAQMGRTMRSDDLHELLPRNLEHARWDDVAARCLGCANCTMACPTCFCTSVEDSSDLSGTETSRRRRWDSCFTMDFSHLGSGSVRTSTKSRYRQWMTHKLATWIDQFGSSGCVGCGRCISWCPVGIDITEEVRAIRESEAKTDITP